MKKIPQGKSFDATLSVARNGYTFVSDRCRELNTDLFETRLVFKKTICMRGAAAARLFYDTEYFERKNVAPNMVKSTLFGHGGVQGLDGKAHRHRKQMFMSLMGQQNIDRLLSITTQRWDEYAQRWPESDQVVLFDEVQELLTEAACEWTGVPLDKKEVGMRAKEFGAMIAGPGSIGPRHLRGRAARIKTERWIENMINNIRASEKDSQTLPQNALQSFALHRNVNGELLDSRVAAVELINVLRPTVAVARFIVFAAQALHNYPEYRHKLQDEADEEYVTMFTHEVRRFYPFFPFVMARTHKTFDWKGYHFPKGIHVLLDIYGTNNHPQHWDTPREFNPERFRNRDTGPEVFDFIPQGGGDFYNNHRCAGEWITIALLKQSARYLANVIEYQVPAQDLSIDKSSFPALPKSRFIIQKVVKTPKAAEVMQDYTHKEMK